MLRKLLLTLPVFYVSISAYSQETHIPRGNKLNPDALLYKNGPRWISVLNEALVEINANATGQRCSRFNDVDYEQFWYDYDVTTTSNLEPYIIRQSYDAVDFSSPVTFACNEVAVDPFETGQVFVNDRYFHNYDYVFSEAFASCLVGEQDVISIETTIITIIDNLWIPDVSNIASICLEHPIIDLTAFITHQGGKFSGKGINGSTFNPKVAGLGNHTITYTYDFDNGSHGYSIIIEVTSVGEVTFSPLPSPCRNDESINLDNYVDVTGGIWLGTAVSGSMFDPSSADIGDNQISYYYTNNGCTEIFQPTITVKDIPDTFAGDDLTYCFEDRLIPLSGANPSGGTWSGKGVVGDSFNPAQAGAGDHTIIYSYTASNFCAENDTKRITVTNEPTVNAGTDQSTCLNDGLLTLQGSPSGGVWSGSGVNGLNFDPQLSGIGVYQLTYTITSGECIGKDTKLITVLDQLTVDAGDDLLVCDNESQVTISGSLPGGGVWSGPGVVGDRFDPAITGPGTYFITYSVTGSNNCIGEAQKRVIVTAAPANVQPGPNQTICLNDDPIDLSVGSNPQPGVFAGPGVTGQFFDAKVSGPGIQTITYTYENGNGCQTTKNRTITVNGLPVVEAGSNRTLCIDSDNILLTGTNPASSGFWQGVGIINGNTFSPGVAGTGVHTLHYEVTGSNGCQNTDSILMNVLDALPTPAISTQSESVCKGSSLSLTASSEQVGQSVNYNWYYQGQNEPFQTGSSIDISLEQNTVILVESVSDIGCLAKNKGSISIQVIDLSGDFSANNTNILSGDLVQFDTDIIAENYHWDFGDYFGTSDKKIASYYYYGAGTYTVTLTVIDGMCEKEYRKPAYINVRGEQNELITSIDNNNLFDGILFYPVPVGNENMLYVQFPKSGNYQLTIYDGKGKKLRSESIEVYSILTHQLRISNDMLGSFFVRIENHQKSKVFKLIR